MPSEALREDICLNLRKIRKVTARQDVVYTTKDCNNKIQEVATGDNLWTSVSIETMFAPTLTTSFNHCLYVF